MPEANYLEEMIRPFVDPAVGSVAAQSICDANAQASWVVNARAFAEGSPSAIQQTIHLLHTLRYAETLLWTPVLTIEEPLIITPAQSEAISLLRKQI